MSMKIDRVKDDKLSWSDMYVDQNNPQYQNLEDEVNYAVIMFSSSNQYFLLPEDKLSHLNFLYRLSKKTMKSNQNWLGDYFRDENIDKIKNL